VRQDGASPGQTGAGMTTAADSKGAAPSSSAPKLKIGDLVKVQGAPVFEVLLQEGTLEGVRNKLDIAAEAFPEDVCMRMAEAERMIDAEIGKVTSAEPRPERMKALFMSSIAQPLHLTLREIGTEDPRKAAGLAKELMDDINRDVGTAGSSWQQFFDEILARGKKLLPPPELVVAPSDLDEGSFKRNLEDGQSLVTGQQESDSKGTTFHDRKG